MSGTFVTAPATVETVAGATPCAPVRADAALQGVATLEQIGEALELKDKQFMSLARELAVEEPSNPGQGGRRFLLFWRYLPLEDNVIAVVLEVTRAQVISYRNKARERLKRMLKGEF